MVVGYCEHKQTALIERAKKAGCDQVLLRSTFSQNLGELVLNYALPGAMRAEEEEDRAAGGVTGCVVSCRRLARRSG